MRIRAATVVDGAGKTLRNATIVVRGSKITSIETASAGAATYDLGTLDRDPRHDRRPLAPGLALRQGRPLCRAARHAGRRNSLQRRERLRDADGRLHHDSESRPGQRRRAARRDRARRSSPGPRVLTSIRQLNEGSGTPDEIRTKVQQLKKDGADVVKIFASASIRDGGKQTMTDAQLEARVRRGEGAGLRTMVHAHSPESIKASVDAGCDQIEHGVFADEPTLKLMADKGVYFDPNVGVVLQNYLRNKAKYLGIGNYNEEGFAYMEKGLALNAAMIKKAVATPNLKMVLGTDAVAGAHGHNADEIVERVRQGNQKPMDAIISATLARGQVDAPRQDDRHARGRATTPISSALDGDPLTDITAVTRVAFVMKGGKVYKHVAPAATRSK